MNFDFCLFTIPRKWKKIVWEMTSRCNMSCQHCCANAPLNLDFDEFIFSSEKLIKRRLEEMVSFGIKEFYLSGGEPFLVENLFDIVKFLKKKKAIVSIATNGFCLNEKIIKKLSEIRIDMLHVSLDGHLPEIHNTLRGGDFFDKIVENLQIIKKYRIPLRVGCIIWRRNEDFLEEMVKFCANLGIKELRFSWLIKVGRFKKNPKIYPKKRWITTMEEIEKLRKKYKHKIKISIHRSPFVKTNNYSSCPGGEKLFFLNPKGQISPCSWIAKLDSRFLTIHTLLEKEFHELIFSEEMGKFKKIIEKRKKLHLQGCPFMSKCKFDSYFANDILKS
jgi:MoaA/NifB/PqqE/SkfB family radical SAM enzyme